jgi:hypothetical protein
VIAGAPSNEMDQSYPNFAVAEIEKKEQIYDGRPGKNRETD